ncbi:ATP-binding protein [Zoogloea dura]|uniref:ATP-binding protein n=1 Tax=Zoogloea dura TaxID=2728840 RepID=UPI00197E97F2|nr:ATP-binding protein [Zoogloea dura]
MLKLQDVFKLSGVPTHTFVKPQEYLRLSVALDTPGRGIIIEGPSGIGKTTSVVKSLSELGIKDQAKILSARKPSDLAQIKSIPKSTEVGLVIIDDFHWLDQPTKAAFASLMKILADEEAEHSKIVLIGINKPPASE